MDEGDHLFADVAAQRPEVGGVRGADQRTKLHRGVRGVGDFETRDAPVPERTLGGDPLELPAHGFDRHRVADAERDRAGQFGGGARPVLERLVDEPGDRHNDAPLIPEPHDDVGEGNLFDAAIFVFNHDDIAKPHRLGDGDLDARDERLEAALGGEADDDARQPRRGENAQADLPHGLEGHEYAGDGHDDHQHVDDFPEKAYVGGDAPRLDAAFPGVTVSLLDHRFDGGENPEREPRNACDRADGEHVR